MESKEEKPKAMEQERADVSVGTEPDLLDALASEEATSPEAPEISEAIDPSSPQALQNQIDELSEKNLRLQAEMQNMKRRFDQDITKMRQFGLEKLIKELLFTLDNLEMALKHLEETNPAYEGVTMTRKAFLDTLARFSVIPVRVEDRFDPHAHEAIAQMPHAEKQDGQIIECVREGYQLYDRVLRPAQVLVVKNPVASSGTSPEAPIEAVPEATPESEPTKPESE